MRLSYIVVATLIGVLIAGCNHTENAASKTAVPDANKTTAKAPPDARPTVRIKPGSTEPFKDSAGNIWMPDTGFADGDTVSRDESLQIANTKDPAMFRNEHYLMTKFSYPLANGKYTVKLYFAETYEGIGGPGQRVFSFNVEGQDVKDFDIWKKTGGFAKADVETFQVNITDGKLDITFTQQIENPEINAIEIIPS